MLAGDFREVLRSLALFVENGLGGHKEMMPCNTVRKSRALGKIGRIHGVEAIHPERAVRRRKGGI